MGGLRLASSPERMEDLKRLVGMARSFGMPMEMLTPKEAWKMFPMIDWMACWGGLHTDRRHDRPDRADQCAGSRRQEPGAQFFLDTNVEKINLERRPGQTRS